MIDFLYNLTRKGWLKALSFILAIALFVLVLKTSARFSELFGSNALYVALAIFYAMSILFIHGFGFEIRSKVWKTLFLPLSAYLIALASFILLL